jgi:hypothetical protein
VVRIVGESFLSRYPPRRPDLIESSLLFLNAMYRLDPSDDFGQTVSVKLHEILGTVEDLWGYDLRHTGTALNISTTGRL